MNEMAAPHHRPPPHGPLAARLILPGLLLLAQIPGAAAAAERAWPVRLPSSQRGATAEPPPEVLRLEVAPGRTWASAAAPGLVVPPEARCLRVIVSETGGGARWHTRLQGSLRRRGEPRTARLSDGDLSAGERLFEIDPRLWPSREEPVQVQFFVEGNPGAYAVLRAAAFVPAPERPNRRPRTTVQPGQKTIATVELMPNLPEPFELIDWREKARAYDAFVFDFNAQGQYLPLVWLDDSRINIDRSTFGLPSYAGATGQSPAKPNSQEGVTCLGAVLGATLAGVDKSRQTHDYAAMCEAWFNTRNGLNLVLNQQNGGAGGSFWYEMFTHIAFYALADRYPEKARLTEIMRLSADRWRGACLDLAGSNGLPDFNHTSFNFRTRKPVDNGKWREPDAAAGMAWIQYAAWKKFGDTNSLAAAESSLQFLERFDRNPFYEVLLPYGALVAARLNAELGRDYNVERLLGWCFGVSDARGGWGVLTGNWGGIDCDGLQGSLDDRGGYAFAMNTFSIAGALVPLARYDPQYARALGKWMLNLANSARLFYPGALEPARESGAPWKEDPRHLIAYEGLRYQWQGKSPCATGDPVAMNWGPKTDLGLYGSSYAGILGAIVRPTTDPRILQLDCLATDFFRAPAYPTFLYYNPHPEPRTILLPLGDKPVTVYDIAGKTILARNAKGPAQITLPADSAVLAVLAPADGTLRRQGPKLLVNDILVDARWP